MQHSDILIVVAECGVALAGFASLISVFGASSKTLDFTRLLGMVKYGLTAAGFSLLPFGPNALGLPDAVVWRGSAAVFLIVHTIFVVTAWRNLARLRSAGVIRRISVSYYTYPAGVISIVFVLLAALSTNLQYAAGFYVCALLTVISSAGVLFGSLFSSFIQSRIKSAAQ